VDDNTYFCRITRAPSTPEAKDAHMVACELHNCRVKRFTQDNDGVSMTLTDIAPVDIEFFSSLTDHVLSIILQNKHRLFSRNNLPANEQSLRHYFLDPLKFESKIGQYQLQFSGLDVKSGSAGSASGVPHNAMLVLKGVAFRKDRFRLEWKLASLRPVAEESPFAFVDVEEDMADAMPDVDDIRDLCLRVSGRLTSLVTRIRTIADGSPDIVVGNSQTSEPYEQLLSRLDAKFEKTRRSIEDALTHAYT
jgi:hypothetical protein